MSMEFPSRSATSSFLRAMRSLREEAFYCELSAPGGMSGGGSADEDDFDRTDCKSAEMVVLMMK